MAESRSGLHKKVSSIFDGAAAPNTGDGQLKAIVPLLGQKTVLSPAKQEDLMKVNLVRFREDGQQKVFALPSSVTVIGRRHNCDLRIPLNCISKRHCQINLDDGILKIRDLGSRNGTILNGVRIDEALIQPGDWMQIGPIGFVFQIDGKPEKLSPPAIKKPKPAQPKKEKSKPQAEGEQFADFEDSDISSALDKDEKDLSSIADILIDDSESLQQDSDLLLDDLG